MRVGVEGRADGGRGGGVVGAGVGQHGVPLLHHRPRQKLAVVAEPDDGDLEARMRALLAFNGAGQMVERLACGVRGTHRHSAEAERSSS